MPCPRLICHKSKKKGHFAKACRFEQKRRQEIKELTDTVETEESDTDRSINIITEKKQLTDRRNNVTMAIRIDGTAKEFMVDTGSLVTIIPPDKEMIKGNKLLPVTENIRTLLKMKLNSSANLR